MRKVTRVPIKCDPQGQVNLDWSRRTENKIQYSCVRLLKRPPPSSPLTSTQCVKVGGYFEVVFSWKLKHVSGPLGWDIAWSNLCPFWSSHFWPFYGQKLSKKGHNGPFGAISRSGGSKRVDQRGSRLDQVRAHMGRYVGTLSRVRNGHSEPP